MSSCWTTTLPRSADVAPRRKSLSDADRQEWAAFARLIDALPGRCVAEPVTQPSPSPAAPALRPLEAGRPAAPPREAIAVGAQPGGLDKSTWSKFRTGRLPTMRTLDLHGRTAQRAYHALHAFVVSAQADGVRCVEIITGRGTGEHGGVLRRELPLWLNQPSLRPLVLAATHPHAANPGAVRLLLRRPR